jgi:uncharacterized protein (DUF362 family)
MTIYNRRNFLKTSIIGGVAATCIKPLDTFASVPKVIPQQTVNPRVSLVSGDNRADMTFRALQPFSKQIAQEIGKKRVVIKPNFVSTEIQLAATHVDTLEGLLEFLKSIGKLGNVIIAESAGSGPATEGYSNFGYSRLKDKYKVNLVDLDQEGYETMYVFDERDFRPHKIRMAKALVDPDSYIISAAKLKTHDRVVATFSLKNIILGAPIKDAGYSWGRNSKKGAVSDKPIAHGSGYRGINYNLYAMSGRLHPNLSLIDGLQGMEGNGPINGTPVDHKVCLASPNWFAADRVGVELMGVDYAKMGYLNFIAQTNGGIDDISKYEIIGEQIKDHIITYKLARNIEDQLTWMKPVSQGPVR